MFKNLLRDYCFTQDNMFNDREIQLVGIINI